MWPFPIALIMEMKSCPISTDHPGSALVWRFSWLLRISGTEAVTSRTWHAYGTFVPWDVGLALQNTAAASTAGMGIAAAAGVRRRQGCSPSSAVVTQKWLLLTSSLEVCGHPQVLSTWFGERRAPSSSSKEVWIRLFVFKSFFSLLSPSSCYLPSWDYFDAE